MASNSPALSAVVPLYNGARHICECVASLVREPEIGQVIVVDDGSTDDGASLAAKHFPNVQIIEQENRGVSHARNVGLKAAKSDTVILIDQDDILLPGSAAKLLAAERVSRAAMVYGDYFQGDDEAKPVSLIEQEGISPDPFSHLLRRNCSASACGLYRREEVLAIGGFDESMMGCEDWDLNLRLVQSGKGISHIAEPVFIFRRHAESASHRFWLMWTCFRNFERKHRAATLDRPGGRKLELARRDRFLNDYLKHLYGPDDLNQRWIGRRLNRSKHFIGALLRDPVLASNLARRAWARIAC